MAAESLTPDELIALQQRNDLADLRTAVKDWLWTQTQLHHLQQQARTLQALICKLTCCEEGGLDVSWPLLLGDTAVYRRDGKLTVGGYTRLD